MAVVFAGVELPNSTKQVQDWIENTISTSDTFEFVKRVLPPPLARGFIRKPAIIDNLPRFKLGVLHWPKTASRFAVAHYLVTDNKLADIQSAIGTGTPAPKTLEINWKDGSSINSAEISDGDPTPETVDSITPKMYFLAARPISQFADLPSPRRQLYILTLVDQRFWWWFKDTGTPTITEGTTTWAQLYSQLATSLGVTLIPDAVSSNYATPANVFALAYRDVPPLLDAVAWACGQRIVCAYNGTVYAKNPVLSAAQVKSNHDLESSRSVRAGGRFMYSSADPVVHTNSHLPGTVKILFPKYLNGADTGDEYPLSVTLASLNLSDFPPGSVGTGFTKTFHWPTTATFTGGGSPTNLTALQNLVRQIATDYYRFNQAMYDVVYHGIVDWMPDGLSDFLEFTYGPSRGNNNEQFPNKGKCFTRIQKGPEIEHEFTRPKPKPWCAEFTAGVSAEICDCSCSNEPPKSYNFGDSPYRTEESTRDCEIEIPSVDPGVPSDYPMGDDPEQTEKSTRDCQIQIPSTCPPARFCNDQTGTTYTVASTDWNALVSFNNASPVAVTLGQAGTTDFPKDWYAWFTNYGAGVATITPTTSTLALPGNTAATSVALSQGDSVLILSDGTNYCCLLIRASSGGGTDHSAKIYYSATQTVAGGGTTQALKFDTDSGGQDAWDTDSFIAFSGSPATSTKVIFNTVGSGKYHVTFHFKYTVSPSGGSNTSQTIESYLRLNGTTEIRCSHDGRDVHNLFVFDGSGEFPDNIAINNTGWLRCATDVDITTPASDYLEVICLNNVGATATISNLAITVRKVDKGG